MPCLHDDLYWSSADDDDAHFDHQSSELEPLAGGLHRSESSPDRCRAGHHRSTRNVLLTLHLAARSRCSGAAVCALAVMCFVCRAGVSGLTPSVAPKDGASRRFVARQGFVLRSELPQPGQQLVEDALDKRRTEVGARRELLGRTLDVVGAHKRPWAQIRGGWASADESGATIPADGSATARDRAPSVPTFASVAGTKAAGSNSSIESAPTLNSRSCALYGCGGYNPSRACQCNEKCRQFNSCCFDYVQRCYRDPQMDACSSADADCSATRCCANVGQLCFQHSPKNATCLSSCAKKHSDQLQVTCKVLANPRLPSLFCFAAVRINGDELDLITSQAKSSVGIFACSAYRIFSGAAFELVPGILTRVLPSFDSLSQAPGALTATWLNSAPFAAAWDIIFSDPESKAHDFFVKVDPDTVFLPQVLSLRLWGLRDQLGSVAADRGIYLQNCLVSGSLQFFGSLEVISSVALQSYAMRGDRCRSSKDALMGEDMWMQGCLSKVGVAALKAEEILRDGYCPAHTGWQPAQCLAGHAAYHPLKAVDQWWRCHEEASASQAEVVLK